jgi:MarR family transcriptional regulator, transcriptional regulator for hemolysin
MNEEIEFLICDTANLWRRLLNSQNKSIGITNIERRIIINVDRNPGISQIELAHLLDIEPQNLIRPLDKLVTENLIEKKPGISDRRSNRLFVTKQGYPILTQINKIVDVIRPVALVGLSNKEIDEMKKNILRIKKNLEKNIESSS